MARKLELWEKNHLQEYLDTLNSVEIKRMNESLNKLNPILFSMFPSLSRVKVVIRQNLLTRETQEKGKNNLFKSFINMFG